MLPGHTQYPSCACQLDHSYHLDVPVTKLQRAFFFFLSLKYTHVYYSLFAWFLYAEPFLCSCLPTFENGGVSPRAPQRRQKNESPAGSAPRVEEP